jgi:hypothetical protein
MSGILGLFTGGGATAGPITYIEDVFSTYLYTGTGAAQTITNNINLSGNGGLVWIKSRTNTAGVGRHSLWDTVRGRDKTLVINVSAQDTGIGAGQGVTSFDSNGFSLGTPSYETNINGDSVVSWTFRKQPKFFDIVTYTGDGTTTRNISHSLSVQPAAFFVKATSVTGDWHCVFSYNGGSNYFMGDTSNGNFALNSTNYAGSGRTAASINISSTTIDVAKIKYNASTGLYDVNSGNQSGVTYVAYLFANNAGGFGLTGSDNVITCGSVTMPGAGGSVEVNLGYEPQWILFKEANHSGNPWWVMDTMRGYCAKTNAANGAGGNSNALFADTNGVENNYSNYGGLTSTGFVLPSNFNYADNNTAYIYIAIRRGPMKVPTDATKVFYPGVALADPATFTTGFPVDLGFTGKRAGSNANIATFDRLRGNPYYLITNSTIAEVSAGSSSGMFFTTSNTSAIVTGVWGIFSQVVWMFQRAPGFFDEVCYTGDGSLGRNIPHSLKVTPEIIFAKRRDSSQNWIVNLGTTLATNINLFLNTTDANVQSSSVGVAVRFSTANTFHVAGSTTYDTNISGATYVAYLFATCPGVSKVGSYTGTGATQTIDCGFASGARFVLVKRTDSTGDWYVWDTARGMVSGTNPALLLNSTAAEVNANSVYTTGVGFQIVSTAAGINASGGTYIFLAIA